MALASSQCGAHLDRGLNSWFVVTCTGGRPSQCSCGQKLSAWFLKLWITTPFWGRFSWVCKRFVLPRGELPPLFWSVLFRRLPSSASGLACKRIHQHVVKTELFLGCCLSSLGFCCNPCCGGAPSCCASHIAASPDFSQPPSWAKTGQQCPGRAQCPGTHCFGTSQTTHPTRGVPGQDSPARATELLGTVWDGPTFCMQEELKGAAASLSGSG